MEMKEILIERLGYTTREADMVCDDLKKLDPSLAPLLERWVKDGTNTDTQEFHGYTIDGLRSGSNMNFIAALLTLDWIIREPEKAIPLIKSGIK